MTVPPSDSCTQFFPGTLPLTDSVSPALTDLTIWNPDPGPVRTLVFDMVT